MLSRTADHLYWMARYTERAENLARLLDVSYQMSLVPQSLAAQNENWRAILALNSLEAAFAAAYSEVNVENVLRFMVSDAGQPVIDLQLPAWRARECARRPRHPDGRDVGERQCHLDRTAAADLRADSRARHQRVLSIGSSYVRR
jgi:uncharacterized alpha-E superfamily protein